MLALVLVVSAAACSDSDGTGEAAAGAGSPATVDAGRVVALGEEFLLADLLALGVRPVASTATVADAGFQGLDAFDTTGIEILPFPDLNLEQVAALRPDRIVALQVVLDHAGGGVLNEMADVVVVPDGLTSEEQIELLGEAFDRTGQAATVVADLHAARDEAASALTDCVVSVATIYPGPSVAAWVGRPNAIAATLLDAGCDLMPDADTATPDAAGRAFLSLEQIGLLGGPELILVQSGLVEGESQALATVAADPLWQRLPAVTADAVSELDRLGYPGAFGEIRLVDDLVEILA